MSKENKKTKITIDDLAVMVAKGFEQVDKRFNKMDDRFDKMDTELSYIKGEIQYIKNKYGKSNIKN